MSINTSELKQIVDKGFSLSDASRDDLIIGFLSLRSALKAWFSTYHCLRWSYSLIRKDGLYEFSGNIKKDEDFNIQANYSTQYYECYSETIFHFHHFFELVIKDILRSEHELMAVDASGDPLVLYSLLKGEELSREQLQKLKSYEFSKALTRIVTLVKNSKLSDEYNFIEEYREIFDKLSTLRNRLVHRGTYILPYNSLDKFVGKYLLPLIKQFHCISTYKGKEKYWIYRQPLECKLDPLDEIIHEYENPEPDLSKIAYLKELGRAAYNNPIQRRGLRFDHGEQDHAEMIAELEMKRGLFGVHDVHTCPVCGCNSLARFCDYEYENPDPDDPGETWLKIYSVKCYCCLFEVTEDLGSASNAGLPLENYWTIE